METLTGSQTPRLSQVKPYTKTLGHQATGISILVGIKPYPWQEMVVNDWMAIDPITKKWLHPICGLWVRRQQGKSQALLMRIARGLAKGERILFSAQRTDTVRDLFTDLAQFFNPEVCPDLAELLLGEPRFSNGQQEIKTKNGGFLSAGTRGGGFGRGKRSIDLVIIDEAQSYDEAEQAAMQLTTANSPNPQIIYAGTPPTRTINGHIFQNLRTKVLTNKAPDVCWHEWSAEEQEDSSHLDDESQWVLAAPSLGISNFTIERMRNERTSLPDYTFETECLGILKQTVSTTVVPLDIFRALGDEESQPVSDIAIGVDMNYDRSHVSVSVCGLREDGEPHFEVVAFTGMKQTDGTTLSGTNWVPDVLEAMLSGEDEFKAVVIDAQNPALSFRDELKRRGIRVTETQFVDLIVACGKFYDVSMNGSLHHLGQEVLVEALAAAKKVKARDSWKLVPTGDQPITPLMSAILALWATTTLKKTKRPYRNKVAQVSSYDPVMDAPMFA